MSEKNATFYQDEHVLHPGRDREREPHVVRRRQLEDSPHTLRHKKQTKAS